MDNPFSLQNQVAIITGSTKGIGLSIAEHMAHMGAKVVISSRKADVCEEKASAIRDAGGEAIAIPCNISRKDECAALVAKTIDAWGRLDSFVANAAVNPVYGPLETLPDEAFDKVMTSNVQSAIWFANLAMPQIASQGGWQLYNCLFDRRSERIQYIRHVWDLQGGRFRCRACAGGRVGSEEHPS